MDGPVGLCRRWFAGWVILTLAAGCSSRGVEPRVTMRERPRPAPPPRRQPLPPLPELTRATPDAGRTAQRVRLGASVNGRPIEMTIFGSSGPTVFIFGGIHGSEPTSADVAQRLAQQLARTPELYAGRRVGIISAANPDGLLTGQRENARKVDLNRNFPARNFAPKAGHGPQAASEPETQAILKAMQMLKPDLVVSIHAIHGPRHCNNFDGPAGGAARLMSRYNGYPVVPSIGYPTPGSFGSWAGVDRQIPVVTLELPRAAGGQQCWEQNRDALLALIQQSGSLTGVTAGQ